MHEDTTPDRRLDRRRFLTTFAVGAGLAPLLPLARGTSARAAYESQQGASLCYGTKRVLNAGDFTYLGAMRLPGELSSYTTASLAARRVGGQLRFFLTGEFSQNAVGNWGSINSIWEVADTGSYHVNYASAPRASVVTQWGDIYQGRRTTWVNGQQFNWDLNYLLVPSLLWKNDRLYWSYYDFYNVSGRQDWCFGMTDLRSGPQSMVAYGPWRPNIGVKHAGGWLVDMPDGTMGVGSPLQSGNIGSSWGPELHSGSPFPNEGTPVGPNAPDLVFNRRHVQYGFPGGVFNPDGSVRPGYSIPSMLRQGNYVWHDPLQSPGGSGVIVEVNPALNGGVGSFTQADSVNNCVYIDLPDRHGVLFAGSLGTGHIWYGFENNCGHGFGNPCGGGQGPNASGRAPQWWIYSPEDLQRVANGEIGANLTPHAAFDPTSRYPIQMGCHQAFGGLYFDAPTSRLYVAAPSADLSIPGLQLPLLHVYQL